MLVSFGKFRQLIEEAKTDKTNDKKAEAEKTLQKILKDIRLTKKMQAHPSDRYWEKEKKKPK